MSLFTDKELEFFNEIKFRDMSEKQLKEYGEVTKTIVEEDHGLTIETIQFKSFDEQYEFETINTYYKHTKEQ